jgi:hypothetical protein
VSPPCSVPTRLPFVSPCLFELTHSQQRHHPGPRVRPLADTLPATTPRNQDQLSSVSLMIRRPKMRRLQGYVEGQKAAETEKAESAKKTRIGSPDWSRGKNRWKSWLRGASLLCVRCWSCVPDARLVVAGVALPSMQWRSACVRWTRGCQTAYGQSEWFDRGSVGLLSAGSEWAFRVSGKAMGLSASPGVVKLSILQEHSTNAACQDQPERCIKQYVVSVQCGGVPRM